MNQLARTTDRKCPHTFLSPLLISRTDRFRSVEGKKYFSCRPKHGGFIRPDKVTAGNFPEEDIDLDLDDDEEM